MEGHQKAVTMLLVANSYEQDDLVGCRRQLDKCAPEDPDTMVNMACVLFKVRGLLRLYTAAQKQAGSEWDGALHARAAQAGLTQGH